MTNTQKVIAGLLVVMALLGALAFFGVSLDHSSAPASTTKYGSTVVPNAQWFKDCIAYGNLPRIHCSDQVVMAAGQNQVAWQNNTGYTIDVQDVEVQTTGTASSTVKFNIGTSTKATATDQFNLTTAPMWSQLVDAFSLATGTPSGLWADNITNHKTGFPGSTLVANGQYILFTASSFCTADGACNTATSTARGWTATVQFEYNVPTIN